MRPAPLKNLVVSGARLFSNKVDLPVTRFTAKVGADSKSAVDKEFSLWRRDYNGNTFEMKSGLRKQEAKDLESMYEARGHHQTYWIKPS